MALALIERIDICKLKTVCLCMIMVLRRSGLRRLLLLGAKALPMTPLLRTAGPFSPARLSPKIPVQPCLCFLRPPPDFLRTPLAMSATNQTQEQSICTSATPLLDDVFKQKRILRSKVREALKSMDPSLRSQEDAAIQNIVLEAPWFKSSKRLCAYISCSALREVDTSKLLSEILQKPKEDGRVPNIKKLYVPRVEDKNSHMRMFNISSMDDLIANSMNILEPAPVDCNGNAREDVMQANEPVDLFILPGLAFDRSGRRLGRGGGYYDTFLRNYQELAKERNWRQPLFVALSYSLQITDESVISVTPNDVPVDALVCPTGVIPISSAAFERIRT